MVDTFTPGGQPATLIGTATQAKCEEACNLNSGCYGYDFERDVVTTEATRCWIQTDKNFAASASVQTNVDQYVRQCSDGKLVISIVIIY